MVRINTKRKNNNMRFRLIVIFFFLTSLFLTKYLNSAESDIYKKIDLFGEVLEKINEEYVDEINQFFCKYHFQQNSLAEIENKIKIMLILFSLDN